MKAKPGTAVGHPPAPPPSVTRRDLLHRMGAALAAAPLVPLFACSPSGVGPGDAGAGGSGGAGSGGTSGTGGNAGNGGRDASTAGDGAGGWATGGTAAMRDKASYPNPFAGGVTATACALTCEATGGPCYSAQSQTIQDISYGYDGLPTRLYFQVLDDSCRPIAGAEVDVWHVSAVGKYSGNDSANEDVAFCTGNDPTFTSNIYFRGKQTTDAAGVVFLDTCYPGWYPGRTVHIHFTVRVGGQGYVTSQLLFDDALNDDIINSQALYSSRGARDATNQNDSVVAASAAAGYLFETQKMTDGALLAWKTLILRPSTAAASCQIPGGGGGTAGGDGGMGPPPGV